MKSLLTIIALALALQLNAQDTLRGQLNAEWVDPNTLFDQPKNDTVDTGILQSIEADKNFLKKLPQTYEKMSPTDMKSLAQEIESKLQQLIKEKEALIKSHASQAVIDAKDQSINSLSKEKKIVDLSVETGELTEKNETYERWLVWAIIAVAALLIVIVLALIALRQRGKISKQNQKIVDQYNAIQLKGSYLEYAARLIRHDLHSGINTYIPRGVNSLEKKISEEEAKRLKIDGALKMVKEGLAHTQRVYRRVHDFTSMVKKETVVEMEVLNVGEVLLNFLETTAYRTSVKLGSEFPELSLNSTLFCTAIDNLVRNGLKYNDSAEKEVNIYCEGQYIVIEDNGRGMSQSEFENLSKPHAQNSERSDSGEGLGLSISLAILAKHGLSITSERVNPTGTKLRIKIEDCK